MSHNWESYFFFTKLSAIVLKLNEFCEIRLTTIQLVHKKVNLKLKLFGLSKKYDYSKS